MALTSMALVLGRAPGESPNGAQTALRVAQGEKAEYFFRIYFRYFSIVYSIIWTNSRAWLQSFP
ncbi:hypothetical protein, partial [Roseinatronobacter sp. NSM]|uniref:hypothetical protein n=1 Tax=Roseinatronobacter sp. NSM TaxID=3457785 RepID=UPI0040365DDD